MTEQNAPTLAIEPLLVRVEEAARLLSLSRSTIYELLDRGELPSVRCGAPSKCSDTATPTDGEKSFR